MHPTNMMLGQHIPIGRKFGLLLGITLATGGGIGIVASRSPLLAVASVIVITLAGTFIVWPNVPTLAVLLILYTNAAVIAVQFHGVPFVIGASVPLLLVIPLAYYLIFRREKLIINSVVLLLIIFLGIQLLGTVFAKHTNPALDKVVTFAFEGLGLYFLLINVIRSWKMLSMAVWTLVVAGFFLGGLSFYQQATKTYDNEFGGFAQMSDAAFGTGEENLQGEIEQRRLAGPIGQQNRYAQIMLMLFPLAFFRFLSSRDPLLKGFALVATTFIAIGVLLTFSRGAAVGFVLMLIIVSFLGYIKLNHILIIVLGLTLLLWNFPQFGTRLTTLEEVTGAVTGNNASGIQSADGSTKSRVTEMMAAVLMFAEHPVIGVGPGMYRYNYHTYAREVGIRVKTENREAHFLYGAIAAENGLPGLVCFGLIVIITLRNLIRTRRKWIKKRPEITGIATGFILAIVGYLMTGIFLHFAFIRYFWLIMALAGAVSCVADNLPKHLPENKYRNKYPQIKANAGETYPI